MSSLIPLFVWLYKSLKIGLIILHFIWGILRFLFSLIRLLSLCFPSYNIFLKLNQVFGQEVFYQNDFDLSHSALNLCCGLRAASHNIGVLELHMSEMQMVFQLPVWQMDGWEISCTAKTSFIKIVCQPAVTHYKQLLSYCTIHLLLLLPTASPTWRSRLESSPIPTVCLQIVSVAHLAAHKSPPSIHEGFFWDRFFFFFKNSGNISIFSSNVCVHFFFFLLK